MGKSQSFNKISFIDQVNLDQKRYSRYVCDSRAIPNEIDGLKPVQRRILWTMWNSVARQTYTKTVKVAGLVMGYHPHGDASIQDAISAMAQEFTFANNYALVSGDGTFGDVIDPKAIASPRYTEVRLSQFAIDAGFFESIPDIDYVDNYDETNKEPVFFVPKIPTVLLNPISGIATGFRSSIHGHYLGDVVDAMIAALKNKKIPKLEPWYRDFDGVQEFYVNDAGSPVFATGFGFVKNDKTFRLVSAPQNWNREKVVNYLDTVLAKKDVPIRDYVDHSTHLFDIELIPNRGASLKEKDLYEIFSKTNNEVVIMNVITSEGRLVGSDPTSTIKRFIKFRIGHLKQRFKRLSLLEKEKIDKNTELIRFIKEKWHHKVTGIKNKAEFEKKLKTARFKYFEWLSQIAVYRMTAEEVDKCQQAIVEAKKMYKYYRMLVSEEPKLKKFMIDEITELKEKWG